MRAIQRQQFEPCLSDSYDSLTRETWFNTTHPLCGQQIYRRVQPIRPLSISVDSKVWKWICRPPYSLTGHLLSYSYFRNSVQERHRHMSQQRPHTDAGKWTGVQHRLQPSENGVLQCITLRDQWARIMYFLLNSNFYLKYWGGGLRGNPNSPSVD